MAAFYRPARTVGGDFYDFIPLPDGRVMFVVGDVTDKGIPAALVMASTHALLRDAAPRLISPGEVLGHVNDMLCVDIPAHMFVTCLALVLDPASGEVEFANAGHDVPYVRTEGGVAGAARPRHAARADAGHGRTRRRRFQFEPGDCALLHSDGLAEAHAPDREMFGFPRVSRAGRQGAVGRGADRPVPDRARQLHRARPRAGGRHHAGIPAALAVGVASGDRETAMTSSQARRAGSTRSRCASEPGNERLALARVAGTVAGLGLSEARLERLKTAVAEATMNAIEHGNGNRAGDPGRGRGDPGRRRDRGRHQRPGRPTRLRRRQRAHRRGTRPGSRSSTATQSPRGWGLFLIRNMVDAMDVTTDGQRHTIWLTMRTGGAAHDEHV